MVMDGCIMVIMILWLLNRHDEGSLYDAQAKYYLPFGR